MSFTLSKKLVPVLLTAKDGRKYAVVNGGNRAKLTLGFDDGISQEVAVPFEQIPEEARTNGTKLYFDAEGAVTGWDAAPGGKTKSSTTAGSMTMRRPG
ncbi:hypothetical protein REBECCA_56 [Erwinia phage Rebecca]|uniref:Uncharacterized protein n=1 Tax=Erwinia phage Rebecca TaxID=2530026 RepID=A0A482IJX6_9CAUD|nr:hypothetical protein REBECCA_56 [Erwinia phage Rebecca]